jgi:hypothetical protein
MAVTSSGDGSHLRGFHFSGATLVLEYPCDGKFTCLNVQSVVMGGVFFCPKQAAVSKSNIIAVMVSVFILSFHFQRRILLVLLSTPQWQVISKARNDALDVHNCSCSFLHYRSGSTSTLCHLRFAMHIS